MKPTKRQIQIAEHFVKKTAKNLLKEDAHMDETFEQTFKTLDMILKYLNNLQRDLYKRKAGSSNKEIEDKIINLISPIARATETAQMKIEDLQNSDDFDPAGGRGIHSHV